LVTLRVFAGKSIFDQKSQKSFWNQCRKETDPTYYDSEFESWIDFESIQKIISQFQSRCMSHPPLSDIDFKNKINWVSTTLIINWENVFQPHAGILINILQQYIDIANINIVFSKIAKSISILNYCWQYIANILIEQYNANFEQYIAHFLVDAKIF